MAKNTHGGKRKGAGRKATLPPDTYPRAHRATAEEHALIVAFLERFRAKNQRKTKAK